MQKTHRDIIHIIFKHRAKLLSFLISIMAITLLASVLMPRIYESSSKLMVKIGREDTYSNPAQASIGNTLFDATAREERINSEAEILTSRSLIENVIKDIGLQRLYPNIADTFSLVKLTDMEKAVLHFQKQLKAEPIKKSDIIRIQFRHRDPVIAAEVGNRMMDRFIELHSKVHEQGKTFNFFNEQATDLNQKLLSSERAYDQFRNTNDISSLPEQKTFLLQQISETELDRARTESEIREVRSKINSLLNGQGSQGSALPKELGQETDMNPHAISAIRSRLSELKIKEQELKKKYAEGSYHLTAAQDEIAKAADILKSEEMTYHRKAINTLQQTLKSLQEKEASQNNNLRTYRTALQKISGIESRATDMERELKINEEKYQLYVKRMEEARISGAMDKERIVNVSVAEPALPPIKPLWPKPVQNMAVALGFGLLGGLGLVFMSEFFSHHFNRSEDIERQLSIPVLSSIKEIKRKELSLASTDERKQLPYYAYKRDLE